MRLLTATLVSLLAVLPAAAAELAIVNARIYPSPDEAPIPGGTVLVRDGRIVAVGPDADVAVPDGSQVIDAAGGALTAGFWNSHVHFLAPPLGQAGTGDAAALDAALADMLLSRGFTTVFDIAGFQGNAAALKARIEAGDVKGPQVLHVDSPFFPEGGTPVYVRELMQSLGAPSAEVASPEQARERARAQLAAGADGVKLFVGAIMGRGVIKYMDPAVVQAVAAEAAAGGKPSFAHPTDMAGLRLAVEGGVGILAHPTTTDEPWDADLVARLVGKDVALVPTLTLFEWELQREGAPAAVTEAFVAGGVARLRIFHERGGTTLFGTDVGYTDHLDTRREFELMHQAGMDWRALLASLTTAPAQRFGQAALRGRIAPGQAADLVVLGADPAEDVAAFADVRATVRAGRVLYLRGTGR